MFELSPNGKTKEKNYEKTSQIGGVDTSFYTRDPFNSRTRDPARGGKL
jgi:hypothetical protein